MWSCSFVSTVSPEASLGSLCILARELGASALEPRLGASHAHQIELGTDSAARARIHEVLRSSGVRLSDAISTTYRIRLGRWRSET